MGGHIATNIVDFAVRPAAKVVDLSACKLHLVVVI